MEIVPMKIYMIIQKKYERERDKKETYGKKKESI